MSFRVYGQNLEARYAHINNLLVGNVEFSGTGVFGLVQQVLL